MAHDRFVRPALVFAALASLGGGTQAPISGPEFSASIDGRVFEPSSAFATVARDVGGTTMRIVIDEVATTCADLDEAHARRIVLGPFVHRGARPIPASSANATSIRVGPDGRAESHRFARGFVRLRDASREPPIVPFDLTLDLEGGVASGDFARGELRVTPCVFDAP